MTKLEHVARAICREDNPCWSMVDEVMSDPRIDGTGRTLGDGYRDKAKAAIEASFKATPAELEMMCILIAACGEHLTLKECAHDILDALKTKALEG